MNARGGLVYGKSISDSESVCGACGCPAEAPLSVDLGLQVYGPDSLVYMRSKGYDFEIVAAYRDIGSVD